MSPRITIGMATYDDYPGVWCTLQSIFLHNDWESPDDVQVVVVDTSPAGSNHRELTQDLMRKGGGLFKGNRTPHLTYVDASKSIPSTTTPREMVFKYATAPVVCVVDCHVMLRSNTLLKLSAWFDKNPECKDLIHGPMLYDNLDIFATHFSDQFRGGMWGTWGTAWKSPKGEIFVVEGEEVTDENRDRLNTNQCSYYTLMDLKPLPINAKGQAYLPSGEELPFLEYSGHDRSLLAQGYEHLGRHGKGDPFEIPGCGMGLFACRKDAWLGFNKDCSGFGGEELNIHTKFRQAGHKAICLPWLEWNHRFGRAEGAPYPAPTAAKIRNYVLWANELGLPLDRIHTHFIKGKLFPENEWLKLIHDPLNYPIQFNMPIKSSGIGPLTALYQETLKNTNDLKEHGERINFYASQARSITAFVKRTDWEPVLAAGYPDTLTVYQSQQNALTQRTHEAVDIQNVKDHRKLSHYTTYNDSGEVDPVKLPTILPTDMLVIDKVNSAEYLSQVLNIHGNSANHLIIIRGTQAFGEKAELDQNKPGVWYAMKDWMLQQPHWFILEHMASDYGTTVLARDPIPRPEKTIRPWPLGYGPGTELKNILGAVGIEPAPNCACRSRMLQMDEWGVDGCKEHLTEIIGWIVEGAESWGWTKAAADKVAAEEHVHMSLFEKASIGWKAVTTGLVFKVNWINPYPDLVNEAIRRAEAKQ